MLLIEDILNHTLQYHGSLNPALWDTSNTPPTMLPEVRTALLKIAASYTDDIKEFFPAASFKGVYVTGSNANYNYTPGSDIDLHVMLSFPTKLHADYAMAKKTVWNSTHKISIHGFPVEIYPHDAKEQIVAGSGWFDVIANKWLVEPVHHNNVDMSNPAILQVANKYSKNIEFYEQYPTTSARLHRLGEKIWSLRDQATAGEFSLNNLAFKELRNGGYIDRYQQLLRTAQDKELGL